MLSNLNSIILEGDLSSDPVCSKLFGQEFTQFVVETVRFLKGNDEAITKEVSLIPVEAFGRLGQTCKEILQEGRGVRVVGRLKQYSTIDSEGRRQSYIIIVAEHVEFKQKKSQPGIVDEPLAV